MKHNSPASQPVSSAIEGSGVRAYALNACKAWLSGMTLRLRPLLICPLALALALAGDATGELTIRVGDSASRHLRKTLFKSRGMPSSTTVEMGTKGRSSMPAARMAYSCAKSSALWNEAYWDCARAPTMTYISKKASRT